MSYCTQADLISRFGESDVLQRSDRERLGVIDTATVAAAIARADADIDGALVDAGYSVPLAAGWARARIPAETLAMFYLYAGDVLPKELGEEWRRAVAWLDKVAAGAIRPPGAAQDTALASGLPDYAGPERVFDADTLDAYR